MTSAKLHDEVRDLNNLTRAVLLEEAPHQNLLLITGSIICSGIILLLIWSSFTQVNEVTKAEGEIIPNGYAQVIQHLEGGIVSQILIEEGDLVQKGQLLMQLGSTGAKEDYAALRAKQITLLLNAIRLRAFSDGTEPNFSAVSGVSRKNVANQKKLYDAMLTARNSDHKVLTEQYGQKKNAAKRLKSRLKTLGKDIDLVKETLAMTKEGVESGAVSKKALIDSKRELSRLEGDVLQTRTELDERLQTIREYQSRLDSLNAKVKDETLQDLSAIQTEIAQNREVISKSQDRVNRLSVRSPVRGLIKGLRINTIGGVIRTGEPLMEIVPLDKTLVVEAYISPKDIGHIKVGQQAKVKVGSYDFSRYGTLTGTLAFVSATTFLADNKESFYRARVTLDKSYVGTDPSRNLIVPGMTVETDIITGKKSVLSYLLKPVHISISTAFQER